MQPHHRADALGSERRKEGLGLQCSSKKVSESKITRVWGWGKQGTNYQLYDEILRM